MGKSDPFCVIKYEDKKLAETRVVKQTLDPVWNEGPYPLPLPAKITADAAFDAFGHPWSLVVEVFDKVRGVARYAVSSVARGCPVLPL